MGDRKVNATGRSSDKLTGAGKKATRYRRPPNGESWIWETGELLNSCAWRAMSTNARRLIDRLLIEHMNHAGTENGNLIVTYDDFVEYGLSRDCIKDAIDETVFLGLIRVVEHGGRWAGNNRPSKYRLSWIGDKDGSPWSNEWKGVTPEQIKEWKSKRNEIRRLRRDQKKQNPSPKTRTTVVPLSVLHGGRNC